MKTFGKPFDELHTKPLSPTCDTRDGHSEHGGRTIAPSFCEVFVAEIPHGVAVGEVFPPRRNDEIANCGSPKTKTEKFCVWKLLEHALSTHGFSVEKLRFSKTEKGKWDCDVCRFSLSHSHGLVAVALSDAPVGVDLERIAPLKNRERVAEKLLSPTETAAYRALLDGMETNATGSESVSASGKKTAISDTVDEFLLQAWTKKEAAFKRGSNSVFIPAKIATEQVTAARLSAPDGDYFLSVATEDGYGFSAQPQGGKFGIRTCDFCAKTPTIAAKTIPVFSVEKYL